MGMDWLGYLESGIEWDCLFHPGLVEQKVLEINGLETFGGICQQKARAMGDAGEPIFIHAPEVSQGDVGTASAFLCPTFVAGWAQAQVLQKGLHIGIGCIYLVYAAPLLGFQFETVIEPAAFFVAELYGLY